MAYAAVISLKQTLHRLLHSSQISLDTPSTREILGCAYNHAASLQQVLKRLDSCSSEVLNEQIRDEAHKLEDLLEFHELNHIFPQSQVFFINDEVAQGIESFCQEAEKIMKNCVAEIGQFSPEQDDDDDDAVPSEDVRKGTSSFDLHDVKDCLVERTRPNDYGIFQITGLPGSGAAATAAAVFEDLRHRFDCYAAVSAGARHERKEILVNILSQINMEDPNIELVDGKGDEEIGEFVRASLKGRKYLILIRDVASLEMWKFLENSFPVQDNGSAVVLTTMGPEKELMRLRHNFMHYDLACRDQDGWWYLFKEGVFGSTKPCPPQLVQSGKKILRNCKRLSIVVVNVILLLLKAEKTPEYWEALAADTQNPIFMVRDEIAEVKTSPLLSYL